MKVVQDARNAHGHFLLAARIRAVRAGRGCQQGGFPQDWHDDFLCLELGKLPFLAHVVGHNRRVRQKTVEFSLTRQVVSKPGRLQVGSDAIG